MKWSIPIIFSLYSLSAIAQVTFEDAANAAKSVPLPAFESIVTKATMEATLPPSSVGDTTALSLLRGENGMGDLHTPGYQKSLACDTKNDPECLAIQVLKRGSANPPKLDEKTVENVIKNHTEIVSNSTPLLGDLAGLAHTEKVCEKVESVIPGQAATQVCDITQATTATESTCEEGWRETRSPWTSYVCTMNALEEQNACWVSTTPVTHDERIFTCTDRKAIVNDFACDVPATVTVEKTYPYTCPVKLAAETKKKCVRTLNVVVTPLCSQNPSETIRLNPFRENYGWKPSSSYLRLEATLTCAATLDAITLTFKSAGSVVATMSTFPASTTITIKDFAMTIDVQRVTIDAHPYLEVLITNVDTGQGTTTIATNLLMQTQTQQEHDVWSESCEEAAS